MKHYLRVGVSLIALAFMSGCETSSDPIDLASVRDVKIETSEQLLVADGDWLLIEDEQASDPMHMHTNARKMVNPSNRAGKQYVPLDMVASAAGVHEGSEDVNYRLIRMQRDQNAPAITSDIQLASIEESAQDVNLPTLSDQIIPKRKPDTASSDIELASENDNPIARVINSLTPAAGAEQSVESISIASSSQVTGIRFGDYPEKTRMVLDLSQDAPFSANLQNDHLILDLPKSAWFSEDHKILNNPLVKSYTASPSTAGGTRLSLELKKPVRLLGSSALPPNAQYGHRIYLDLAAS